MILNDNCGKHNFTVPADLAPATISYAPKSWPGVSFPRVYPATDPGILIDIYETITSYTILGPTTVFMG